MRTGRLAHPSNRSRRAAVAQDIENYANSQAQLIKALSPVTPTLPGQMSRDAYCAIHHG